MNVTKLNLASQPFRNRALPWIITAIITGASLLALVLIISESRAANARTATVASSMDTLRKQEAELLKIKDDINRALAPEQRELLEAAHILVDRKQFSWSLLFADLEAILPSNVRVIRINVRDLFLKGNQASALLELTVMSKSPTDVTNMMTEMNRGGVFYAQAMSQNLPKGRDQSGMEWVLSVNYRPPAGAPAGVERPATVASAEGGER